MASSVVGFSVGDFVATIKFAVEVYKSCKKHGGAATKSQSAICELESYCTILEKVKEDSTNWTSPASKDEAIKLLSVCRAPIEEFNDKFKKRWNRMASKQAVRFVESFHRNARWAFSDANQIEKLRAQIESPINALGLLIDLEIRFLQLRSYRKE